MRVKRYLAFLGSSSRSDVRIIQRVQRISPEKLATELRPFSLGDCSPHSRISQRETRNPCAGYIDVVELVYFYFHSIYRTDTPEN